MRLKDINGQIILKTFFGMLGESLLLSDYLLGYNIINSAGETEASIAEALHKQLNIPKEDIAVYMLQPRDME